MRLLSTFAIFLHLLTLCDLLINFQNRFKDNESLSDFLKSNKHCNKWTLITIVLSFFYRYTCPASCGFNNSAIVSFSQFSYIPFPLLILICLRISTIILCKIEVELFYNIFLPSAGFNSRNNSIQKASSNRAQHT